MKPTNVLILMSDQHNPKAVGYAGHPIVQTPHLDALANGGTWFSNAYSHSPICVPARASFATGRYVHETRHWDNASPYHGEVPSWAHRLAGQNYHARSIGKLHYRSEHDANGFDASDIPMHVVQGKGDLLGCLRKDMPPRPHSRETILNAGRDESTYTRYDDDITATTVRWLTEDAPSLAEPWVLFCSMVCPHPPKKAPPAFYDLYPLEDIPWPVQATASEDWNMHPATDAFRRAFRWSEGFSEFEIRNALAAYLGQISFLDANIGQVLAALDASGLRETTRIIYTSDHGDNMGNRGLWNKNNLYEDSAGVPLILNGPGIPSGKRIDEPVTHLDVFPTVIEAADAQLHDEDEDLPGTSLVPIAHGDSRPKPVLLSQYHAGGSITGSFLMRDGPLKYVHFVGLEPQLFNLDEDPHETNDLAADPDYDETVRQFQRDLETLCDPAAIDAAALSDQAARVEAAGGRDAVIGRGSYSGSPVPGQAPNFNSIASP